MTKRTKRTLGDYLREEGALRRLASSDEDALVAYRRLVTRVAVLSTAIDRISRRDTYGSLHEELDMMRSIAIEAMKRATEI